MSDDNRFDWNEPGATTVPEQEAIAVYTNGGGAITIRQRSSDPHEEDSIVVVQPNNAAKVAQELLRCAEELLAALEPTG